MIDRQNLPSQTTPADIEEKASRVRALMDSRGLDAVIISRADNFAWFTCGGSSTIVRSSELGFGLLIIARDRVTLVAQVMDGPRIIDEELQGLDVEYVPLRWYEQSREWKAADLIKGMRALSDCAVAGAEVDPRALYALHYPLTDKEIARLRWLGRRTDGVLKGVADSIAPGTREIDVAARLQAEYALSGIDCDVLLVGSDERIARYRHTTPSDKRVQRYLLLHPAARKWGLHANVTRFLSFGEVPAEARRRYDAACRVHATALSMCVPGQRFSEILEAEKETYRDCGFADEWHNHFQGGVTGYLLAEPTLCMSPENEVAMNMAYDWFITITGAKSEELGINTAAGVEVPSATGIWPTATYESSGTSVELPDIYVREP